MIRIAAFGISALMLAGCNGKNVEVTANKAKDNEIIVTEKNTVQTVIKEKFDKKYYKEKELTNFINEDLKEFNEENDTKIKLNSIKVKDKNVYAVIDYKTMMEYNEYNDYKLTSMNSTLAKESSIVPDKLKIYGREKKVAKSEAIEKDMKVVVLQEKVVATEDSNIPSESKVDFKLTVAGKIKYISGATKDDSNTAEIKSLKEPVVIVYK